MAAFRGPDLSTAVGGSACGSWGMDSPNGASCLDPLPGRVCRAQLLCPAHASGHSVLRRARARCSERPQRGSAAWKSAAWRDRPPGTCGAHCRVRRPADRRFKRDVVLPGWGVETSSRTTGGASCAGLDTLHVRFGWYRCGCVASYETHRWPLTCVELVRAPVAQPRRASAQLLPPITQGVGGVRRGAGLLCPSALPQLRGVAE